MSQLEDEPYEVEDANKSSQSHDDTNSIYSAQSAPQYTINKHQHQHQHQHQHHKKERIKPKKHLKVIKHNSGHTSNGQKKKKEDNNKVKLPLTDDISYNESIDGNTNTRRKKKKFQTAEGAYSQLSKQERREFRMAFRLFDKDDDGQISVYELKKVFDGLNYHFTEQQLITMLKSIDDNGDGKVDIDEFVCVMKGSAYSDAGNVKPYVDELREAFEVFDKDGDGQITPQELAAIMKALGENLNEQDIFTMIQEADADGDGNIDFEEFKKLMEQDTILGWDTLDPTTLKSANSGSSNSNSKSEDSKEQNGYNTHNNNNNNNKKVKRKKRRTKEY